MPEFLYGIGSSGILHCLEFMTSLDLMSGNKAWEALKDSVKQVTESALKENHIFIGIFGFRCCQACYIKPNAFLFSGTDDKGKQFRIVCHFSQLAARVTQVPRTSRSQNRLITGFSTT